MKRAQLPLLVVAALLACLTAAPPTGWLVRAQFRLLGGQETSVAPDWNAAGVSSSRMGGAERDALSRHPGDLPMHLAAVLRESDGVGTPPERMQARTRELEALRPRFPDQPALDAAILRHLCRGAMFRRDEEHLLDGVSVPEVAQKPQPRDPRDVASLLEAAARGERLDPENGFFPAMASVGHFARREDDAALAAWARAAACRYWEDYVGAEIEGQMALTHAAHGETGMMARSVEAASILLPHYASLRASARVATVKAVRAEQAGRTGDGLAIRRSVQRVGAKMRVASNFSIGSLVGTGLVHVGAARPGGLPPSPSSSENPVRTRVANYSSYLRRTGQGDEAAWFESEARAGEETKALLRAAAREGVLGGRAMSGLFALWITGQALLLGALWTALLGGIAAVALARSAQVRKGSGLPPGVGAGLLTVAALPALAAGLQAGTMVLLGGSPLVLLTVGVVLLGLAARHVYRHGKDEERPRRRARAVVGQFFGTVAASLALGGLASVSLTGTRTLLRLATLLADAFHSDGDVWEVAGVPVKPLTVGLTAALVVGPLLPLLWTLRGRRRRGVSLSAALVQGQKRVALPVVGVLVLLFCVVTVATAVLEASARAELSEMLRGETAYLSRKTGKPLPGPVTEPAAAR